MTGTLDMLACQIQIPAMQSAVERDSHVQRVARQVDHYLAKAPADLVVMPELSCIDYSRQAFANLDKLAEPPQGASFDTWSGVAERHRCWVVYGYAAKVTGGYTIATAVINPAGECHGVYHKLHLAQFGDSMEKEYFTAGERRLVVGKVCGFTFSPIICYDIRAPELCRTLAVQHNVDLILHTGAYARDPSFYSWHAFATTRAVENQLYLMSLNRAGAHFGASVFCPPWIDDKNTLTQFAEHDEDFRRFTLTIGELKTARTDYTFLQDRLPDYDLPVIGG